MFAPPFSTIPVPAAIRSDPNQGPCVKVSVARSPVRPRGGEVCRVRVGRGHTACPRSASSTRGAGVGERRHVRMPPVRAQHRSDRSRREPGRECRRRSRPVTARRAGRTGEGRRRRPLHRDVVLREVVGVSTPPAAHAVSQIAAAIAPVRSASAPTFAIVSRVTARSRWTRIDPRARGIASGVEQRGRSRRPDPRHPARGAARAPTRDMDRPGTRRGPAEWPVPARPPAAAGRTCHGPRGARERPPAARRRGRRARPGRHFPAREAGWGRDVTASTC